MILPLQRIQLPGGRPHRRSRAVAPSSALLHHALSRQGRQGPPEPRIVPVRGCEDHRTRPSGRLPTRTFLLVPSRLRPHSRCRPREHLDAAALLRLRSGEASAGASRRELGRDQELATTRGGREGPGDSRRALRCHGRRRRGPASRREGVQGSSCRCARAGRLRCTFLSFFHDARVTADLPTFLASRYLQRYRWQPPRSQQDLGLPLSLQRGFRLPQPHDVRSVRACRCSRRSVARDLRGLLCRCAVEARARRGGQRQDWGREGH